MNNIFEKHISNTQKRLRKYNSLILKSKYDKEISDELIQSYIEARYYNEGTDEKIRIFYRRIYDVVKKKSEKLIKKYPRNTDLILDHLSLIQYYFYFDNVRNNLPIENIIESIDEKRITKFNLRSAQNDNFKDEFTKLVQSDLNEVYDNLELYDSGDFYLDIKKIIPKDKEIFEVKLRYTFEFPEIFSEEIIEEVFNTDITSEDKLFVEYPMITNIALKDVIVGNFNKKYVCEFAPELFNKKKKLEQLLDVMDNQMAQDKIIFKIGFNDYLTYKNELFKLINRGFKFALVTNEDMPKLTKEEITILEVFSIIITNTKDVNKKQYKKTKILEVKKDG